MSTDFWVAVALFVALTYLIGAVIMYVTGLFASTQTNPVQDFVRWMPTWLQLVLWPLLLLLWWGSDALQLKRWSTYISHESYMEYELNRFITEIENTDKVSIDSFAYHTPSRKEWTERSRDAFELEITIE